MASTPVINRSENPTSANLLQGRLLLVAAAVLWSTTGVVLKSPPLEAIALLVRGPALACYRAGFAVLFLLPFVKWKRIRWRPALVPMTVAFAAMNVLYISALTRTTAAAAIFLQYTSSVWAFLLGVVLLKEPVDRRNLLALAFAVCGIGWIVAGEWGSRHLTGNLLALGSGFSYACVILTLRLLRNEDSAGLIALNHVVGFVILLPWVAATVEPTTLDAVQWTLIAVMGIAALAVPYVLFARGIREVPTQEAGLLCLLEPILNPVWVWLFWREANTPAVWIGGGLILAGLAARYLLLPPGSR